MVTKNNFFIETFAWLKILIKKYPKITFFIILYLSLWIFFNQSDTRFLLNAYEVTDNTKHNEKQLINEAISRANSINDLVKKNDVYQINKIRKRMNFSVIPCKNLSDSLDSCGCSQDLIREINIDEFDSTKRIDVEISTNNAKINLTDVEGLLREWFDKELIPLTISININGGKYLVTVNDSKENANNFEEAKEKVAILLLKYTSPISYVSLMNNTLEFDAEESLNLAITHDLYKDISKIYTLLGEVQFDKVIFLQDENYLDSAERSFKNAISSDSKNEIATIGLIKIKRYKKTNFTDTDRKSLDKIIASGKYSNQAYIEKFKNLEIQQNLIKDDIYAAIKNNPDKGDLNLFFISYLLTQDEIDDARNFISFLNTQVDKSLTDSTSNHLNLAKMLLSLSEYEITEKNEHVTYIENQFHSLDYCEKNLWIKYLDNFSENRFNDSKVREMLKNQLANIEREGKGDFSFYLKYGNILHRLGYRNDALEVYNKALEHSGPQHLVHLDMARVLLDIGQRSKNFNQNKLNEIYFQVETHAKKSLHQKQTYEAALLYTAALFFQQKYKLHVSEFKIWKSKFKLELDKTGNSYSTILLEDAISNCELGLNDSAINSREEALKYSNIDYKKLQSLEICLGKSI